MQLVVDGKGFQWGGTNPQQSQVKRDLIPWPWNQSTQSIVERPNSHFYKTDPFKLLIMDIITLMLEPIHTLLFYGFGFWTLMKKILVILIIYLSI